MTAKYQVHSVTGFCRQVLETFGVPHAHQVCVLLPFGGHKGYGLALFVELLCGVPTRSPFGLHILVVYGFNEAT